jgi:hypothetical protein
MRTPLKRFSMAAAAALLLTQAAVAEDLPQGDAKAYSPPVANKAVPTRVLWGDTHLHTGFSFDAGLSGARLTPEDAYRFARGEQIVSNTGLPVKLRRPLDFLVVSDHSDFFGLPAALREGSPELLADPLGKQLFDAFHSGGPQGFAAVGQILKALVGGQKVLGSDAVQKAAWARSLAAADKYNDPGRFTSLLGFEWSSTPNGDNLHRNVIFRDGVDKVGQLVPLATAESGDPEHLWQYLAAYEKATGGQALAIPHNSNLSGGLMFADRTFGGQPFDRAYAEERAKWEPVAEITQTKGDSETLASLSPSDDFATFERWDRANIAGSRPTTPEQQPFNYIRPALKNGLKLEQTLGVNPFKFGVIGSTDSHTGLSTNDPDNFFGKLVNTEPGRDRANLPALAIGNVTVGSVIGWELSTSGIAAVWAADNTRESLFDAFRRKEVYGTTGPRITVRVFAGWEFKASDIDRSDFVQNGYAHGVPMGGDLTAAQGGKAPVLLIQAAKDPEGANLDRVQVVKGWVDAKGETHEKVFDVAWSGSRKPGKDGKLPSVGNTVDLANATYSNSIGTAVLNAAWTDRGFDPHQRAFYYVRVIQIPTPRWVAFDVKRFGTKLPDNAVTTLTDRAYTSPIWFTPS